MMRRLIATSLKFRRLIVALAALLIVFGVTQVRHMAVDQLPEFGPTTVEVRTEALGLSAAEVEQLITTPLEQDLLNLVPFVEQIHSESVPGLSSVVMIFEPGTSLLDARQVVAEKVAEAAVALPGVSSPPHMLQPLSATSRVLVARLTSPSMSLIEMSVLARWAITPRILGVPGVANVSVYGQRDRQLQVLVDPDRLDDQGVTLQQVINTAGNALWVSPLTFLEASTPGTAGFIDTANQRLGIRHVLPVQTADDLAQIPLDDAEGTTFVVDGQALRLGDVATIVEDHQPLIGDASLASDEGLLLVVERFPDANTVEVTRGLEEAFDAMRPGLGDLRIDTTLFRPADQITSSTSQLWVLLAIGAALLVVSILLFTAGWRPALLSVIVIALSLLAAGAILYVRDVTANMMIIAGLVLAVGVVVNDAVMDVDNIVARLRRHDGDGDGTPVWQRILDASLEMRSALAYATLITIASAIPAFFLTGEAEAFLPSLVLTYFLAILASMLVVLTATPAFAMMLLSRPGDHEQRVARMSGTFRWLRSAPLERTGRAYAFAAVMVLIGLLTIPMLDGTSRTTLKDDDVLVQVEAAPGTSLQAMREVTTDLVADLGALDGVRDVSAHVGRAVNGDRVVGVNSAQVWVHMADPAGREAVIGSVRRLLEATPAVTGDVLTYPEQQLTESLQATDEDVVVRLYGIDLTVLRAKAAEIRDEIAGIEGVRDPRVELPPDERTLEIEVDLERAQRFAVKPGDVRRSAAILLSGLTVGNLFEEQKVFDVVVWGTPEIREGIDDVRNLLIDTPSGVPVRLEEIADVRVVPNPTVIQHEAVSNYLDVSASIDGRDADAVVADVERAVSGVTLPPEHHAEIRGSYAEEGAARARLLAVALASAIAVFLLLQAAFASWRLAILVLATLPAALAGGGAAIVALGGTATIGSVAGFVAVLAIAIRNAIVFIKGSQRIERTEGLDVGPETVSRAVTERLPAIVTSAIATALMMVPLVLRGDVAGLEIVRPMAAVVIGGLVSSTLVAIFVLPALYVRHGRIANQDTIVDDLTVVLPELEPARSRVTAGA